MEKGGAGRTELGRGVAACSGPKGTTGLLLSPFPPVGSLGRPALKSYGLEGQRKEHVHFERERRLAKGGQIQIEETPLVLFALRGRERRGRRSEGGMTLETARDGRTALSAFSRERKKAPPAVCTVGEEAKKRGNVEEAGKPHLSQFLTRMRGSPSLHPLRPLSPSNSAHSACVCPLRTQLASAGPSM